MKADNAAGAHVDGEGEPGPLDGRAGDAVHYDHIDERVIDLDERQRPSRPQVRRWLAHIDPVRPFGRGVSRAISRRGFAWILAVTALRLGAAQTRARQRRRISVTRSISCGRCRVK